MAFGASSANILNITYLFAPLGTKNLRLREGLIWSGQRDCGAIFVRGALYVEPGVRLRHIAARQLFSNPLPLATQKTSAYAKV